MNVAIEFRWANGRNELVLPLAEELVKLKVNIIVGSGSPLVTKATTVIPIVKIFSNDPVEDGIVTSLNRPGGNITGVDMRAYSWVTKRFELLREAVPNTDLIAVLNNPTNPPLATATAIRDVQAAALKFGQQIFILKCEQRTRFGAAIRDDGSTTGRRSARDGRPDVLQLLRKQIVCARGAPCSPGNV